MALETGNYINDLVATNPTALDAKSQGDNHFQLVKLIIKQAFAGFTGVVVVTGTDTGTASAHVLTPTTPIPTYGTNMILLYRPVNAGTGACTVAVSGLTAKSIKTGAGADPTAGDITAAQPLALMYDGTNFVIIGGSGMLSKTGNQTLTGNLTQTGNQTVSGTQTIGGTLTVAGAATMLSAAFSGAVSVAGALTCVTVAEGSNDTNAATTRYADRAAYTTQYGSLGTSSTSLTLDDVTHTLTASTGKTWTGGQELRLFASAGNYMDGICNSYNEVSGAMSFTASSFVGTGTFATWQITPRNNRSDTDVTRSFFLA